MNLRFAFLLLAAIALILTGCAQREWQEVTPSSRRPELKTPKKHTKEPREEDDTDEPKDDLLK